MSPSSRDPNRFLDTIQIPPRRTAVDVVIEAVRTAIVTGVLAPGEKVNEEMLADKLKVSRMPVRQALRALEAEGLITLIPHSGAVVSGLTPEELEELYFLRATLEAVAIARAVPRHTDETLRKARSCIESLDTRGITVEAYMAFNREFHDLLYAPCGWHRLTQMIAQITRNVARYIFMSISDPEMLGLSYEEHWEILKACEDRDVERAEKLIRQHVLQVGQTVVNKVRAMQQARG